jgi:hypothetical protein
MNNLNPKPAWLTPEVREHLRRIEYDYQSREFGEEMARINFLPPAERRREISAMMDHALRKGVAFDDLVLGVTR